jgi:mannose-6-phosphate isomerase-like protein (cupin superfamily)
MKIINYNNADRVNNPHGVDARKLYGNDHVQAVHILLKAGESLKKHSAEVDVFFYILEGEGIVEIGDEKLAVTKDTLIVSPKNIPHCLYNESSADFRVLVVKTPAPTTDQNKKAIANMLNL